MSKESVEALRVAGVKLSEIVDEILNVTKRYYAAKEHYREMIYEFNKQQRREIDAAGEEWEKRNFAPTGLIKLEHEEMFKIRKSISEKMQQVTSIKYIGGM